MNNPTDMRSINTDKEIKRLRNLMSVLNLKRRDLIKKQKELSNAKIILDKCISKKKSFVNNNGNITDPIIIQNTNLEILDAYDEYKISQEECDKILKNVNHLTNIISYIDIEYAVDNVLAMTATTSM